MIIDGTTSLIGIIALASVAWNFVLHRRLNSLLSGSNAQSLEGHISHLNEKSQEHDLNHSALLETIKDINARLATAVRGVGTTHFNALGRETVQSFATALLNESGSGVIISTMRVREVTHIYAKVVHHYRATQELSDEEEKALEDAIAQIKMQKLSSHSTQEESETLAQ